MQFRTTRVLRQFECMRLERAKISVVYFDDWATQNCEILVHFVCLVLKLSATHMTTVFSCRINADVDTVLASKTHLIVTARIALKNKKTVSGYWYRYSP